MPSLAKLQTLKPSSTDDEVYAVYEVSKSARQFNPVKQLRDRVPYDIASKTKKRAGQYIQFDLYVHYQTDDYNDPTVDELTNHIKELRSMDMWPKKCPPDNIVCQNYRGNVKNYQAQLRRIKTNGRKLAKYKKYSARELKSLLSSSPFVGLLNEMIDTTRLHFKFTLNSIKSIQKVTAAFIRKSRGDIDVQGSVWRLRCKCIVIGKPGKQAPAKNISYSLDTLNWKLSNNIADRLIAMGYPYRGNIDVVDLQVHNGERPAAIGKHFIALSKPGTLQEVLRPM